MRAVVIDGFGDVDQLRIQNVDDPPIGRGEVPPRVRHQRRSGRPEDTQRRIQEKE